MTFKTPPFILWLWSLCSFLGSLPLKYLESWVGALAHFCRNLSFHRRFQIKYLELLFSSKMAYVGRWYLREGQPRAGIVSVPWNRFTIPFLQCPDTKSFWRCVLSNEFGGKTCPKLSWGYSLLSCVWFGVIVYTFCCRNISVFDYGVWLEGYLQGLPCPKNQKGRNFKHNWP